MKEYIQYIGRTHTSKEEAKSNKKLTNTIHSTYLTELDFEEIVEAQDTGLTIARVDPFTNFLVIDIDESTVNIVQLQDLYKNDENVKITYSSSLNPLKYHIFVKLANPVSDVNYKKAVEEKFKEIHDNVINTIGRCNIFVLDDNADTYYQCFFGVPQNSSYDLILKNSTRLFCWTKKSGKPLTYIQNKPVKKHMSMNSADYCRIHNLLTVRETKRYDIILPSMTNGKMKPIAEGFRYNWSKMIGAKILLRAFYLNEEFKENWTKKDFMETYKWAVYENVINPNEFLKTPDFASLCLFFDNKWSIIENWPFSKKCEELEAYFQFPKRQYKSREYNTATMNKILNDHFYDYKTCLFVDRNEIEEICKQNLINYYSFINYIESLEINVKFEVYGEKTRKKKLNISLDNWNSIYSHKNNTYFIPKSNITQSIRNFASRHCVKIKEI